MGGGELCPFNQYSITLCQLLQHLHNDVKNKLFPVNNNIYPIVLGTKSYLERLAVVKINNSDWGRCWIVSGDFSNAYTLGKLSDLNEAVPPQSWTSNKDRTMLYLSYLGDRIVVAD